MRRDLAEALCTTAEGVRGKRAVQWGLVDALYPKSRFDEEVAKRADTAGGRGSRPLRPGVELSPIEPAIDGGAFQYEHVTLTLDDEARTATIEVRGPAAANGERGSHSEGRGTVVAAESVPGIGRCVASPPLQSSGRGTDSAGDPRRCRGVGNL